MVRAAVLKPSSAGSVDDQPPAEPGSSPRENDTAAAGNPDSGVGKDDHPTVPTHFYTQLPVSALATRMMARSRDGLPFVLLVMLGFIADNQQISAH
jgi:hypothetical protein